MLFFACEPPYSRVHHTRSHCIYSKGPLQCNRLWWPRARSLDTAGHSEWLCFNNSKSGQSGHLFLFLLSGGCPSSLFRIGVCCYPVSSPPDHVDVSWLSTFFELRSFLVPAYEKYTTWKLPQKKTISEEKRSRVTFFYCFECSTRSNQNYQPPGLRVQKKCQMHIYMVELIVTACWGGQQVDEFEWG